MISEVFFSTHYTSVWKTLTPAMDDFIRRVNMEGYERDWTPIESKSPSTGRWIINDAAFRAFSKLYHNPSEALTESIEQAFHEAQNSVFGELSEDIGIFLTEQVRNEVGQILSRLSMFFRVREEICLSPSFVGSGIISSCKGDALSASTLYEMKGGDRSYRAIDFRQTLVYLSLHFFSSGSVIERSCILDPRRGTHVEIATEDFCSQVSGESAVTLFHNMNLAFASSLVSD